MKLFCEWHKKLAILYSHSLGAKLREYQIKNSMKKIEIYVKVFNNGTN
jgi:hypothetical protein